MTFRVLLTDADRFPPSETDLAALAGMGAQLHGVPHGTAEEELIRACRDADALLIFAAKITRRVVEAMPRCKILARCGAGYDNIDLRAAVEQQIRVTHVPDFCAEEVSDHAVALLLDCCRKVTLSHTRILAGRWDSYPQLGPMRRLAGRAVGLVGFGRIARAFARKMLGFGVRILAFDPHVPAAAITAEGVAPATLERVLREAEILCLFVPATPQTRRLINAETLAQMRRGAILINVARGALIEEAALAEALASGQIDAAGLDVLESEPPTADHPLLRMEQVVFTPHSAAFSEEAMAEVKSRAIAEIGRAFRGEPPLHPVPGTGPAPA